jgi:uncharacterized low-complexity protein
MKRFLTPITVAAAAGALALGAAAGAVAASAASSPSQPSQAQIRAKCENRAALRVKLRNACRAERQKENVFRLDPSKRQELAKPILDQAVADGQIPAKARDRILKFLGTKRP